MQRAINYGFFCLLILLASPVKTSFMPSGKTAAALGTAGILGFAAGCFFPRMAHKIVTLKDGWFAQRTDAEKVTLGFIEIDVDRDSAWDCLRPLRDLFSNDAVKGIVLLINGSSSYSQAECLVRIVNVLKDKYAKPVIAYSESPKLIGAGYMLACAADQIMVSPVTAVGNIGAQWTFEQKHEKNQEEGIEYYGISKGKFKGMTFPDFTLGEEERQAALGFVNRLNSYIVQTVSTLRPQLVPSQTVWAEGKMHTASQALSLHLVDGILIPSACLAYMQKY